MKPPDATSADTHTLPPLSVSSDDLPGAQPLRFTAAFRIGRTPACELCIPSEFVSRVHAEVIPTAEGWEIRDLHSSNGVFLHGKRIERALLAGRNPVRLGAEGPLLTFETQSQPPALPPPGEETILARYAERYLSQPQSDSQPDESLGEHTQFIRRAFAKVQAQAQTAQKQSQTRRTLAFSSVILALLLAGAAISRYTWRLRRENQQQRQLAHEIFYAIKTLDIEIAQTEQTALAADKSHGAEVVDKYEARRRQMQDNYDRILLALHIDNVHGTEQHRLIVRVAHIFGECELDIPPHFEQEIMHYISLWQSSGRYARDIRLAQKKGYTRKIPQALLERGLPVQFFYLAMQESDFDPYISGPITRKGYAKGMWQFIPETGVQYGLHLGPLVDSPRPDPADERDQVDKSTDAASRYLDTLYSTDAQASGLLIMACYNWGEGSVLPLVRSMPANPRQRNFWRLLADHRNQLPQQTYDYVFMITAAAVIGENPRLFGFDFDNPLARQATD